MTVDTLTFQISLVASGLIMLASMMKYGLEQNKKDTGFTKVLYLIVKIIGFLVFAYITGFANDFGVKTIGSVIGAVLAIVGFILSDKTKLEGLGMGLYIGGIVSLSMMAGIDKTMAGKVLAGMAPVIILLAEYIILPYQRDAKVVDGPGMLLSTVGYAMLSAGNSMFPDF